MELDLDKKLYSSHAIEATIEAFSPFSKIIRLDDRNLWRMRFEEIDAEFQEIITDEFANYALGLTAEGT